MHQQRILIAEDEGLTRLMLEMHLQYAGYTTIGVSNGESALDQLRRERFDLLITDLHMPGIDGLQMIAEARRIDSEIGAIILTGAASTASAVAALNQQVHRYLLKPVLPDDLLRSVGETLARRRRLAECGQGYNAQRSTQGEDAILRVGPLHVDLRRHHVTYDGQAITLSSGEFSLLRYLIKHRGTLVSAQEIAREVLRYPCSQQEAHNLSKSRVYALRRKIEGGSRAAKLIHNVRGAGYRILDDDEIEGYRRSH